MAQLLEPGRVLGGRYRLESEIARGGMGTVWRAADPLLAREVALKTLDPVLGRDEQTRARFRREAIAAAAVAHPNIVATYDTGEDADDAFIVMELVEGRTLRQVIDAMGALPIPRSADIAYQVADALSVAHARGLIHRDVKPGNVLVQADGRVKVTDFGIAKATGVADDEITNRGVVVGTARYLAPEQVDGGAADERSDVYALGLVLSEMLTGTPPFAAETDIGTAVARLTTPPRPISVDRADVPAGLEHVATRALSRDADERWQSAAAMRDALSPFRVGAGHAADPTVPVRLPPAAAPAAPAPPERKGRRRTLTVALLVVAFAIGVGGGYAIYRAVRDDTSSAAHPAAPEALSTLQVTAAHDFDPQGDGSENPEQVHNVLDGAPTTSWHTDRYFQRDFGGIKQGVGIVLDLGAPRSVREVGIDSPDTNWGAQIYALAGNAPDTLEGWGQPLATGTDLGTAATLSMKAITAQHVLVWFNQLPSSGPPYQLHVSEVHVLGN